MDGEDFLTILIVLFFVVIIGGGFIYSVVYAFTINYETIIIEDKWTKYKGQDAKYLVSSTDGQVFEITDSWTQWRFDSSNTYAKLKQNQTCSIKTQGFRFGFFSDYKNIIHANCK